MKKLLFLAFLIMTCVNLQSQVKNNQSIAANQNANQSKNKVSEGTVPMFPGGEKAFKICKEKCKVS